jgi:hypothetical protein
MAKEQGLPPGIINRSGKYGILKKVPEAIWGQPPSTHAEAWAPAKAVDRQIT